MPFLRCFTNSTSGIKTNQFIWAVRLTCISTNSWHDIQYNVLCVCNIHVCTAQRHRLILARSPLCTWPSSCWLLIPPINFNLGPSRTTKTKTKTKKKTMTKTTTDSADTETRTEISIHKIQLWVLPYNKDKDKSDTETRRGRYCCTWPLISPIN